MFVYWVQCADMNWCVWGELLFLIYVVRFQLSLPLRFDVYFIMTLFYILAFFIIVEMDNMGVVDVPLAYSSFPICFLYLDNFVVDDYHSLVPVSARTWAICFSLLIFMTLCWRLVRSFFI